MRTALLIIGSALPVFASLAYVLSIVRGKSRPERMTRFLLVVITALMVASLWATDDTSGIWLAWVSFVQAIFIFGLSLKYGMGGRDRLDYACLALCGVGIGLWLLSDWPWMGLIASIAADCIAMIPALRKTIRLPHTELTLFYAVDTFAGLFILFAGPYTLKAMALPAYIAAINFAFVLAIEWPRRQPVPTAETEV
ncbi:MAG TPA: hypothetical protein VLH86_03435 [Patescibacteria group bacterium]|nr:hypothetical protein [Patescibacteria group bacterium]